jgi:hypothetical protein
VWVKKYRRTGKDWARAIADDDGGGLMLPARNAAMGTAGKTSPSTVLSERYATASAGCPRMHARMSCAFAHPRAVAKRSPATAETVAAIRKRRRQRA